MQPKLVVVDGHALLFRAFFAVRGLTAPDGRPTNAVFGFLKSVTKILDRLDPQYLVVCLDSGAQTFRKAAFEDYKAQRKPVPPELVAQFPMLVDLLEAMSIPVLMRDGFEADDLIAAVVGQAEKEETGVIIVSRDKDLMQLLSDTVSMYDDTKEKLITPAELMAEKGLTPEQIPDWIGLMGDSSDNIPGVPKVGEKTAVELLKEYGSMEAILAAADEIKQRKKAIGESIAANADIARYSRELATLVPDVGIDFDLAAFQRRSPVPRELAAKYREFGFNSLLRDIEEQLPAAPSDSRWALICTEEALQAFVQAAKSAPVLSVDTETTGFSCFDDRLIGISLAIREGEGCYIPVAESYPDGLPGAPELRPLPLAVIGKHLEPLLTDPNLPKVGHNLKFDINFLRANGLELDGAIYDTLIAAWLLSSGSRSLKLDDVALDHLGISVIPISAIIGKGKTAITMDKADINAVAEYAAEDADVALRLWNALEPLLHKDSLFEPCMKVESPLVRVIADMEYKGIRLDPAVLSRLSVEVTTRLESVEKEIHGIAGDELNINSPLQLGVLLFDKLGLTTGARGSRSTDARILDGLKGEHPVVPLILEYRFLQKLKSTYLDALAEYISPATGRVHSSFNQTGTVTGRLSSNRPNLQNIPARDDEAREIRSAFTAEPGHLFVSADYSQVELRVLAHLSGDSGLVAAFKDGLDIHTAVAMELFEVAPDQVTRQMRATAKAVNFGLVYGQGAYGLAAFISVSRREAAGFIDRYFTRFPMVREFKDRVVEEARETGYILTIAGRRRQVPQLRSRLQSERAQGERLAMNSLIQGSAADIIKAAMLNIRRSAPQAGLDMALLLQIHDELLYEVPQAQAIAARDLVVREMESAVPLSVPLTVSAGIGADWLELK